MEKLIVKLDADPPKASDSKADSKPDATPGGKPDAKS
jgi:hypothetical protein